MNQREGGELQGLRNKRVGKLTSASLWVLSCSMKFLVIPVLLLIGIMESQCTVDAR